MNMASWLPTTLLVGAVAVPAGLVLAWPFRALRSAAVAASSWAAAPALALALLHVAGPWPPPSLSIPALVTGIQLGVDATGGAFLLLTALLWFAAGAFARGYHAEDPGRDGFFGFFVLTMTGNLGLVLAQDLVSFYLFFALMTFAAYGLVVHTREPGALRAGRVYIVMAIAGEMALLGGVLALGGAGGGTVGFGVEIEAAWARLAGDAGLGAGAADVEAPFGGPLSRPAFLAGLLVVGFAVKAGIVPFHLWLPLAHPVAPTAASALLSGVMIKAGLLGWLRVLPEDLAFPSVGGLLLLAGAVTALYGVAVGLAQDDPKTVLAYSSVSQMGYMAMGTGVLVLDPRLAPAALTAIVLYALHHGTAKATLFLSVGVVDRVGGGSGPAAARWRRGVLWASLVPALALAGMPLTAGALAKASFAGAASGLEAAWVAGLDPLLFVAAMGTTLLMARFVWTLAGRSPAPAGEAAHRDPDDGKADTAAAAPSGGPWGLVLPWAALLLAVAVAPSWAVWAIHVPPGVDVPSVFYGFVPALLPVALGAAAVWWVRARPGALGPVRRIRIPPGDLLVLIEAPVRRISLPAREGGPDPALQRSGPSGNLSLWLIDRMDALSGRDLESIRGPVLAVLVLGTALALVVALMV